MGVEEPGMAYKDVEAASGCAASRGGCFCFPCLGPRGSGPSAARLAAWWRRVHDSTASWSGVAALKKLREWSELVAGPKWKTFIRRFNRNRSGAARLGKFQYDPLSYALNFDEGQMSDARVDDEDGGGFPDFSTRYAPELGKGKDVVVCG